MQRQQLWQLQQQQLQLQQQQKLLEFQLLQQHINQINSTQQLQQTQQQQQPEEQRQQVMLQPQQQTAYADNVGIIYCSNVSTRSEVCIKLMAFMSFGKILHFVFYPAMA